MTLFFSQKMVPDCKPEWNREAKMVFSRLPCLMAADKPCPQLQPSLPWPKTDGFCNLVRFWVVPLSVKESISS